ncbi:hypothetical protein LINGRAPRIM_LOCUS2899 [Linum grandiflorum]
MRQSGTSSASGTGNTRQDSGRTGPQPPATGKPPVKIGRWSNLTPRRL